MSDIPVLAYLSLQLKEVSQQNMRPKKCFRSKRAGIIYLLLDRTCSLQPCLPDAAFMQTLSCTGSLGSADLCSQTLPKDIDVGQFWPPLTRQSSLTPNKALNDGASDNMALYHTLWHVYPLSNQLASEISNSMFIFSELFFSYISAHVRIDAEDSNRYLNKK